MKVRDIYANRHWILKRSGNNSTGIKGRHCSLDHIANVYLDWHQKPNLKSYLHLSDSYLPNIYKTSHTTLDTAILQCTGLIARNTFFASLK